MATIKDLQKLDLKQIENKDLLSEINSIIEHHKEHEDPEQRQYFEKLNAPHIETLLGLVKDTFPKALPPEAKPPTTPPQPSKKEPSSTPAKSFKDIEPDLEDCREKLQKHREQHRKKQGPPKKKNRYTLLRERLLALLPLMPKNLEKNQAVQKNTESILLSTHRKLVDAWEMTPETAKKSEKQIHERFDKLEEKSKAEDRKKLAQKLRDTVTAFHEQLKAKQDATKQAQQKLEALKEVQKSLVENPSKARQLLKTSFSKVELKELLSEELQLWLNN